MKNTTPLNANNTAYEQAQEWFIQLQAEPDNPQLINQFQCWLDQAEENEQLYLETCLLWQDMGTASKQISLPTEKAVTLGQPTIQQGRLSGRSSQPIQVLSKRRIASALSLTTLFALIALFMPRHVWYSPDYFTAIGEQQTIRLADGSTLHLNSQSAVNVHYSDDFRDIELLYGEAFFEVAKHQMRPFRVISDKVTATAVGTAFNVRQLGHEVQTTLTEGKLKVRFAEPSQKETNDVMLNAGQAVTFTESGEKTLSEGHSLYLPDWKRHILRLDDVPLADVVALLNRQYATHLLLLNTDRATENMTGVIPLGDLDLTLKMLNKSLHLEATEVLHQVVILH